MTTLDTKTTVHGVDIGEWGHLVCLAGFRSGFLADGVAAMTPGQWRGFVQAIKDGELDHIGQADTEEER